MRDLLVKIAKRIVKYPNQVRVKERKEGQTIFLELVVAREDMGKIIGRKGATINAIQTIMRGAGGNVHERIVVELLEYSSSSASTRKEPEKEQMTISA